MAKLTGTNPDQVPTNADLGTMAYQDTNLFTMQQDTNGDFIVFRQGGTEAGVVSSSGGSLLVGEGSAGIKFNSGSTKIIPRGTNNQNVDGTIDLGGDGDAWKDLYLSGGVYLGGTGAANRLNSYEEGTWTPNGNWTSPSAVYRKIGSVVHITMDLTANSTGGTSQITNLPFSCNRTMGTGIYTSGVNWNNGYTAPTIAVAGNIIYFRAVGDNLAFSAMAITANATVHASFTYETTA